MNAPALSTSGLSVELGGRMVVTGVSLDLAGGSLVALVGPNGAGKSSLLRALVGILPYRGRAMLGGEDLGRLAGRERARRLAYLPQGHEVHWPLPVRDVVALGRLPGGAADPRRLPPEDSAHVAEAMRATDALHLADRAVTELSGGERARVALARVLAVGAPAILADEPTAALDPRHQLAVMATLRERADRGALVLAVTHDLALAARFGDRIVVMEGGRIAAAGPPDEALGDEVLRAVFGIAAFRATHEGASVVVPWR